MSRGGGGLSARDIDFLLRKSSLRANYSVSLAEPYHPIIFKTVGYHNCLLNNSIKLWRCNLCLCSKLSSAFDAEIEESPDRVRNAATYLFYWKDYKH